MRATMLTSLAALAVFAAPVLPGSVGAHAQQGTPYPYVLVDVGTFGGPQAFFNLPGPLITDSGIALGSADTTIPDGHLPAFNPAMVGFPDPFIVHAFEWRGGHLTDMGALPGNNSSAIFDVNASGAGVGMSGNGAINPVAHWPEDTAVMWKNGQVINLGTLPGALESQAIAINGQGQVEGFALNDVPDQYSMIYSPSLEAGTQTRTFFWQNGAMRDIGTLGGADSLGLYMNTSGQVAGQSYTNSVVSPNTGVPTQDPFLWQNGHMQDLGTLGGVSGSPTALNDLGQVAGASDLAGDQSFHPFLWSQGKLKDLGTLGGDYGGANYLNDLGIVVGWTTTTGNSSVHPFLWKNGVMSDLGTVAGETDPCAAAWDINYFGQVVGNGGTCSNNTYGVLWQHGIAADVNSLVAPSALHVYDTQNINDLGIIGGLAAYTSTNQQHVAGQQRMVLLIPAALARAEGITQNVPAAAAVVDSAAVPQAATRATCAFGVRRMRVPAVVRSYCSLG